MSFDEVLAGLFCGFIAASTWAKWVYLALTVRGQRPASGSGFAPLLAAAATAAVAVWVILARFSSHDVRDSFLYIGFYALMTLAASGLGLALLDRLGLSLRDDAIERQNPAAGLALGGAILGVALAFGGANIGDGPGWWVVVFSGALSVSGLLLGWVILDRLGQAGEAVVVERDQAAGLRVGAWFVATGAITGRAAAGDWVDFAPTVRDFVGAASGALVLAVIAAIVESLSNQRPPATTAERNSATRGLSVALLWLGLAAAYLAFLGAW
jgi:uncharacterized membrane protein YjfL (UPF0719 family)